MRRGGTHERRLLGGSRLLPAGPALASSGGAVSPTTLISQFTAADTWKILSVGDLGVGETTVSGRAATWASQQGGINWATAVSTNEPTTAVDTRISRRILTGDAAAYYMTNAYNPPAPLTTPFYRIAVARMNSWAAARTFHTQGSSTSRTGLVGASVPSRWNVFNGTTLGPHLEMGAEKWYIIEEWYDGTTTSYCRFDVSGDLGGIDVGNFNSSAFGLFGTSTGTALASSSVAFYALKEGVPSNRATLRGYLKAFIPQIYNGRKLLRYNFIGDSQTRHDVSYNYAGFRKRLFDDFDQYTGADYPTRALGSAGNGTWRDNSHSGVSGNTIENCTTAVNAELGSAGTMTGAGWVNLAILCIGAANLIAGETAAVALPKLQTCAQAVLDKEKIASGGNVDCALVICSPAPFLSDPPQFADFADGIPAIVTALQAANPGRTIQYVDYFTALGRAYNAAYYVDDRHLNATGSYTLAGGALSTGISSLMNTLTTY